MVNTATYQGICLFLEKECGITLGANKQYLVKSRLSPLLNRYQLASLDDLLARVQSPAQRELKTAVIDAMTTNETLWFRDSYPFELLARELLPQLKGAARPLRFWSAASSTGQEAYSIAMTALEFQARNPGALPAGVQILGTDISQTVLSQAQKGEYDPLAMGRGLSPERRRQYFDTLPNGHMQVVERVRRLVSFRSQNLLASYALLGRFDIVFCRNVLIYFSPELKLKIVNQLASVLNPGGYLFLGASESLPAGCDKFEMIRQPGGIVYRLKSAQNKAFSRTASSAKTRLPVAGGSILR